MAEPADKKARHNEPAAKPAKAKPAKAKPDEKQHVIPHKIFVKFTDELFMPENSCCYDQWIGQRSDWGDDEKLLQYERAHADGTTADFWHNWKTEVSTPTPQQSSASRA